MGFIENPAIRITRSFAPAPQLAPVINPVPGNFAGMTVQVAARRQAVEDLMYVMLAATLGTCATIMLKMCNVFVIELNRYSNTGQFSRDHMNATYKEDALKTYDMFLQMIIGASFFCLLKRYYRL